MIDIKTIKCPQCGSTDAEAILTNNKYKCEMCGSTFMVSDQNAQDVEEIGCYYGKLESVFSKDDFYRKTMIEIAKSNTPIDVFDAEFGEVVEHKHQIYNLCEKIDSKYQASVGYDRKEAYIGTEKYRDMQTHTTRERQVTKYRTVTDWSLVHSEYVDEISCFVENGNMDFCNFMFSHTIKTGKDKVNQVDLTQEEIDKIEIIDATITKAEQENYETLGRAIKESIPGDHVKDLSYQIKDREIESQSLYLASEYELPFTHYGKKYSKKAFAFGDMTLDNSDLPTGQYEQDSLVWDKMKFFQIGTMVMLLLSIILCFSVKVIAVVVVGFILALGCFIVSAVLLEKTENNVSSMCKQEKYKKMNAIFIEKGIKEYHG